MNDNNNFNYNFNNNFSNNNKIIMKDTNNIKYFSIACENAITATLMPRAMSWCGSMPLAPVRYGSATTTTAITTSTATAHSGMAGRILHALQMMLAVLLAAALGLASAESFLPDRFKHDKIHVRFSRIGDFY